MTTLSIILCCIAAFIVGVILTIGVNISINYERKPRVRVPDLPAPPDPEHTRGELVVEEHKLMDGTIIYVPGVYRKYSRMRVTAVDVFSISPDDYPTVHVLGEEVFYDEDGMKFIAFRNKDTAELYLTQLSKHMCSTLCIQ